MGKKSGESLDVAAETMEVADLLTENRENSLQRLKQQEQATSVDVGLPGAAIWTMWMGGLFIVIGTGIWIALWFFAVPALPFAELNIRRIVMDFGLGILILGLGFGFLGISDLIVRSVELERAVYRSESRVLQALLKLDETRHGSQKEKIRRVWSDERRVRTIMLPGSVKTDWDAN